MKWRVMAAAAMLLLSLIPQIHLWFVRGGDWNGAYASIQGDESIYSAYLNARMNGRPRRNDPFAGQDSTPQSPLPESAFSIQFIPPLVLSFFARTFGATASTAFIVLAGTTGILSAVSVFWLLTCIVDDRRSAFAGTLFVLCLGGMAGRQGLLALFFQANLSVVGLPFLRLYQPAAAFPLFFVFCVLVWHALTIQNKTTARARAVMSGVVLGVLVFSYFYLWTAAVAWLACISLLWFCFRHTDRSKTVMVTTIVGVILAIALAPYAYLVSHRTVALDEQHFNVTSTHQPDLSRIPEMLGALTVAALVIAVWRKVIQPSDNRAICAASFALLPMVVFNQQILTGKNMQPFHYEAFIANYAAVLSLVMTVGLLSRRVPSRVSIWIAAFSLAWAALEQGVTAVWISTPSAVTNDRMIPVLLRLKELSNQDGTLRGLHREGKSPALIFSPQIALNVTTPTWTSQGTLLDTGGLDFGTATRQTRKESLYAHLYYSNADAETLRQALYGKSTDIFMNYYPMSVIFGHDRIAPFLSSDFRPVQPAEIEEEVRAYQSYVDSFSRERVTQHLLTYVIASAEPEQDLSRIDLWYERDAGERAGAYNLYRLTLRE